MGYYFYQSFFVEKKIGPLELSLISKEIIRKNGRKLNKNKKENNKSKRLLIKL